jgi:ribosomal protein L11 methyltransferase
VRAFDSDPDAVKIARTNAQKNRVQYRIRFNEQALALLARRASPQYSVVCANLISDLLISERNRIAAQVSAGGILVLAGILAPEFPGIHATYESLGMKLIKSRVEKEWRSGAFLCRLH